MLFTIGIFFVCSVSNFGSFFAINILEVDHRRLFLDVPAKGARLDVTVETRDAAHAEEILAAFRAEGFAPVRIATGDAMD